MRVFSDPSSNIYNLLAPLCRFIPTRRQVPIEGFISYAVSDKWARWGILKSSGRNKELNSGQMSKVEICRSEIIIRAKHKLRKQHDDTIFDFAFLLFWDHRHNRKIIPRYHKYIPHICHGRHGRRPCKFFLTGINFYRFNAKNWHFRQILREKVAFFFYRFNAKNWRFSV